MLCGVLICRGAYHARLGNEIVAQRIVIIELFLRKSDAFDEKDLITFHNVGLTHIMHISALTLSQYMMSIRIIQGILN